MYGAPITFSLDPKLGYVRFGQIVLILLLVVGILSLILLRNRKLKGKILVTITALFLVVATITLFFVALINKSQILQMKRAFISDIPQSTKLLADNYVVSKVGQEYFINNFIFNQKESFKDDGQNLPTYHVTYDFLPLKRYSNYYTMEVTVKNNVADSGQYSLKIPDCLSQTYAGFCEFNLSREEFVQLQEEYKFNIENVEFKPPYLYAYICESNQILKIDYKTKTTSLIPIPTKGIEINPCTVLTF